MSYSRGVARLKRYLAEYRPQLEQAIAAIHTLESPNTDEDAFSQALADLHVCATVLAVAGGETAETNLALACVSCSLRKRARQQVENAETGLLGVFLQAKRQARGFMAFAQWSRG